MAPYVMVKDKKILKITFDVILSHLTGFSRQKHLRINEKKIKKHYH